MAFDFIMPGRTVIGEKAMEKSKPWMKSLGNKALVVTDGTMRKLGNLKVLQDILQEIALTYAVYDEVDGEPTDVMVEKGLKIYQKEGCDCLIALGGGSPIDTMKAIGVLVENGGSIADYMGKEIEGQVPPMAAIPTTAGTGSEATQFTIITDTKKQIKMLLKGSPLMPGLAVVDPYFTMTAPPSVTAATGLDAFTHAVEAYTSQKATELSDIYALSAVRRIVNALPRAFRNGKDKEAREEMSMAAFEAGVAFNNSSVTVVHGMSRPVGALFHVPHGISNAMLLKGCLSYILEGTYERFGELGRVSGAALKEDSDEEASRKFLKKVEELCQICEIPSLAGYGIERSAFFGYLDKMIFDAMESKSPGNTRKMLAEEDLRKIYIGLWED